MARSIHQSEETVETRKIIMLGAAGVGKSSLFTRWVDDEYLPTRGLEYKHRRVTDPSASVSQQNELQLKIWDAPGNTDNVPDYLMKSLVSGAQCALLVFDVTNRVGFEELPNILRCLKARDSNIPYIVVANKCDASDRQVSTEEASSYAKSIGAINFLETSAKESIGIDGLEKALIKYFSANRPNVLPSVRNVAILEKITQFEKNWADCNETTLTALLKAGLDQQNKQDYFEQRLPLIQSELNKLRWTSTALFNSALNLVVTILLAATVVGLPLAYFTGLLEANEKKNGHMLSFFAFGEQHATRSLCLDVFEKTGVTLSL